MKPIVDLMSKNIDKLNQIKFGVQLDLKTVKISGIAMNDYPKFTDAYIESAKDNEGIELTSEELDKYMYENEGFVCEFIHDNQLYLRD